MRLKNSIVNMKPTSNIHRNFMTEDRASRDSYSPEERLEVAQHELRKARLLLDYSSKAYLKGNLQRSSDARSRANILCARAAEHLTAPELDGSAAAGIRSMVDGIRDALAVQPLPFEFSTPDALPVRKFQGS